jgi:hypothetical protein
LYQKSAIKENLSRIPTESVIEFAETGEIAGVEVEAIEGIGPGRCAETGEGVGRRCVADCAAAGFRGGAPELGAHIEAPQDPANQLELPSRLPSPAPLPGIRFVVVALGCFRGLAELLFD